MSQHWKSLLVVLVIIGAIVFFYRNDKDKLETALHESQAEQTTADNEALLSPAAIVVPVVEPVVVEVVTPEVHEANPAQAEVAVQEHHHENDAVLTTQHTDEHKEAENQAK